MIRDFDIVRARVYAVAPKATPSYRWTGQDGFVRVTDNILRLTAANGLEGWSSTSRRRPRMAALRSRTVRWPTGCIILLLRSWARPRWNAKPSLSA